MHSFIMQRINFVNTFLYWHSIYYLQQTEGVTTKMLHRKANVNSLIKKEFINEESASSNMIQREKPVEEKMSAVIKEEEKPILSALEQCPLDLNSIIKQELIVDKSDDGLEITEEVCYTNIF